MTDDTSVQVETVKTPGVFKVTVNLATEKALAMAFSSVSVVSNALRLRKFKFTNYF